MTRLLILVAIVVGVLWWLFGRKRADTDRPAAPKPTKPGTGDRKQLPAQIVACAHCGVHLPQEDTVADAQGRLFCGEAHRLAGPR